MISDDEIANSRIHKNTAKSITKKNDMKENPSDSVENSVTQSASENASINPRNAETIKIEPYSLEKVSNTDKIQQLDEIGNPDSFELDLALAHKNDKQKVAEILEIDRDILNGDEIDEDSVKSTFLVGELGDEDDIDILPMILKRNSQLQKKYDIDDLKQIKINRKKD
ncbi:MAG: hypothetical protein K8S87_07315 [Planctomycetes bacterium]|nr:hypothetical protein [Planctomycetota bacterium]